jgi:hypothetical protein
MHDAPPPGPVDLTFTSTPVATVVPGTNNCWICGNLHRTRTQPEI